LVSFWIKTLLFVHIARMTYIVLVQMLNHAQSQT